LSGSLQPFRHDQAVNSGDERALAFSRSDFAALSLSYRQASRDWRAWLASAWFIGCLGLADGLMSVAEHRHWPASSQWWLLLGGWVLGSIPMGLWMRRDRHLLREHGLLCPHCDAPLVDTWHPRGRAEKVLALGECTKCRTPLFPGEA
jgi:hypothetical protein